jgi:uncharacterized phiE125 gp8 family phage protein
MTLTRIAGPSLEPVTLNDMKLHLRVTHDSEDALISNLIKGAREEVEQATGLALITQQWRLYLDCWPQSLTVLLQRAPVLSLDAVTIFDESGTPTTAQVATFVLDRTSRPARIAVPDDVARPGKVLNGIEIDFTAGFGATGVEVPDGLKRAVMLLAAHWYEYRGAEPFDRASAAWPPNFERIISRYRRVSM